MFRGQKALQFPFLKDEERKAAVADQQRATMLAEHFHKPFSNDNMNLSRDYTETLVSPSKAAQFDFLLWKFINTCAVCLTQLYLMKFFLISDASLLIVSPPVKIFKFS